MREDYKKFLKGDTNRPLKKTLWCNSSEFWMGVQVVVILGLLFKSLP